MDHKSDPVLTILIVIFLSLLTYAGFLSYKSIDYKILDKLEATPLNLPTFTPTPIPQTLPPHSSTN